MALRRFREGAWDFRGRPYDALRAPSRSSLGTRASREALRVLGENKSLVSMAALFLLWEIEGRSCTHQIWRFRRDRYVHKFCGVSFEGSWKISHSDDPTRVGQFLHQEWTIFRARSDSAGTVTFFWKSPRC